jgi:hypothetical protein
MQKRVGWVAQVIGCLPSKCKALSLTPSTTKNKQSKTKQPTYIRLVILVLFVIVKYWKPLPYLGEWLTKPCCVQTMDMIQLFLKWWFYNQCEIISEFLLLSKKSKQWEGKDIRRGCGRINMVEMLCTHVKF